MEDERVPRWRLTLEQFRRTLSLLEEAVALTDMRALSDLEKSGLIGRFHNCWEAGWKTLADYLIETEDSSLSRTPGSSVRLARAVGLIEDGDSWLNAGKVRNVLVHEYSLDDRDEGLLLIRSRFLPLLQALSMRMEQA